MALTAFRRVSVISMAAAAVAATASTAVGGEPAHATGLATRSVSKIDGQYLTSYRWADGSSLKILDLRGGVTATLSSSGGGMSPGRSETSEPHEGGVEIDAGPNLTGAAKIASLSVPIADTTDAAMVATLGAPPSVVDAFARQDSLNGVPATVTARPTTTSTTASMIPEQTAAASTRPLYNRSCFGGQFDGNRGGVYGCFNQYLTYEHGADWYLADQFYSSAYMHDAAIFNPDELTGLQQGVAYGAGNAMNDWQPRNSVPGGNCSSSTVTLGAFGQSYSVTSTKCPEVYGLHSISQVSFYTKWDGEGSGPHNGSRDTGGVDVVHSPPTASPVRSTYLHYWYE